MNTVRCRIGTAGITTLQNKNLWAGGDIYELWGFKNENWTKTPHNYAAVNDSDNVFSACY